MCSCYGDGRGHCETQRRAAPLENRHTLNIMSTLHMWVENTQKNDINMVRQVKNDKQSGANDENLP